MEHKDYTEIHAGTFVTREMLDRLGSPDGGLKIIHIAGTNGKGSTAEYFTRILVAAGKRVGTFTSPAVYDFYDQFKVDGEPVKSAVIEKYFERAQAVSGGLNPTDFEIQTAGAILAFKEEGCEYAVLECGMGGLNDATNAVRKKELAVITSISLEHTRYLGNTIEEICEQKAGIVKNCPVIVNACQPSEAATSYFKGIGGYFASRVTYAGGNIFRYCGAEYEIAVGCKEQAYNAATAIEGARLLGLPENAIYEGVKSANLSGRTEEFNAFGRRYILDGAHNAAAFGPLCSRLNGLPRAEITVIFGCLIDKDIEGNLHMLSGVAGKIIAVECESPRKMPLEEIEENCRRHFDNVSVAKSVSAALGAAFTKTVVVCGSFTLLKEAKLWIEKGQ